MSLVASMLRFARAVVEGVMRQVASQLTIIDDAVKAPMQAFVNEVTGGMWKGAGANRFVESITTEALPLLMNLGLAVVGINASIGRSIMIVEEADMKVCSIADQLNDVFEHI